jgi:glycosyltransferase involved in cell wall biosynthesis
MRALHLFPIFATATGGGSERYQHALSRKLVELGIEVDVFAIRARSIRPRAAFALNWERDGISAFEHIDGIDVRRFPARWSPPGPLAHSLSSALIRRWEREEKREGVMLQGSRNLIEHYRRRAQERPAIYDWLAMLGRGPNSMSLMVRMAAKMRQYDVVLAGFMPFATLWQATVLARMMRKPVALLALFHAEDIYHHFRIYYRCFERADAVIVQTPYAVEMMREVAPRSNPILISPGIEPREYLVSSISGDRFRKRHGLEGHKIILFAGRKEPGKRYDLAIDAVDLIDDDRVRLVMAGPNIDGRTIESRRVLFLGELPRDQLLDAYDACDVLILPSEHESFGIVILEAWIRKKPVLGNAFCRAVASVIDHGRTGYLCAGAADFAERIVQLISDPAAAHAIGEAGYDRVLERYTEDLAGLRLRDLYRELIASREGSEESRKSAVPPQADT